MLFDFRSVCLPYCLDKQEDGFYMPRNREYRHLGIGERDEWNHSDKKCSFRLTKSTIKKIAYGIVYNTGSHGIWMADKNSPVEIWYDKISRIYLYDDGCVPTHSKKNMDECLKKIALLAKAEASYYYQQRRGRY